MTKHEAIKKLIALFGPDPETNEAIKLAMIALIDTLDEPDPKPAKAKPEEKKTEAKPKKATQKKRKPFDNGKMRVLLEGGWDVPKIADEMGVTPQTIYNHMKEEGLVK